MTAVIAAAGSGERLGVGSPKAFVPLVGRPLIEWSIAAFRAADGVGPIVIACPPGHAHDLAGDDIRVVDGGETRAESVANALSVVDTDLVAIHDAARPLVTPELIEGVIEALLADAMANAGAANADTDAAGAIAATPVTDTIKQARARDEVGLEGPNAETTQGSMPPGDLSTSYDTYRFTNSSTDIERTLDRGRLWAAQTPQVFHTDALREAMDVAESVSAATDEAMLIEATGGKVLIHPAPPENMKITTPRDLRLAELLLTERSGPG